MTRNYSRVSHLSHRASSVKHTERIAYEVQRSCAINLKKTIEPKIRQNERERTASMDAAARCIVGGK